MSNDCRSNGRKEHGGTVLESDCGEGECTRRAVCDVTAELLLKVRSLGIDLSWV